MSFDSIRCYDKEEIPAVLERLSNDKHFINLLSTIYPLLPKELIKQRLVSFDNVDDFQKALVYPFLQSLESNLTKGIKLLGLDKIDKNRSYLHVSNHRDIILDSTLLCGKLIENDMETVEIAIGDNLLVFPWIEDFVRLNKSFIVRRNPGAKQMLESSKLLSAYMAHTINEKKRSIWIAQREGRAKDSDDRTQESLLKMFNMGGTGTFTENLAALHICPLSISYEYDPCDYLKAKEFQQKRDNSDYKKSPQDDLLSMKIGVMGYKGRIVYKIAGEISDEIRKLGEEFQNRNELVAAIASLIDEKIHSNYEIFKVNKIAYDILNESTAYKQSYSLLEKLDFEKYVAMQIAKIDLENKDIDFLNIKILEMYANPLRNALFANKE